MDGAISQDVQVKPEMVDFQTELSRYKHWRMAFDGPVATLTMDVSEDGGIRRGYKLKLNSYDLGVDIELHDALQRIRFEHPEIRAVMITSAKPRVFCSVDLMCLLSGTKQSTTAPDTSCTNPAAPDNAR